MEENEELIYKLRADFERSRIDMHKCLGKSSGGERAEKVYGRAYQRLVKAGLAEQLKKKYRQGI
jgi:hypothetical protein